MSKPILFYISHGYGANGDPGAVSGRFIERDLNAKVARACDAYLFKNRGKKKYKITYPERKMGKSGLSLLWDNLKTRYYNRRFRVVSVDIHFNAGGGNGMECYCKDTSYSKMLGRFIANEFAQIGQEYHGNPIKGSRNFKFLKNKGTSVLIECGFLDSVFDRKDFDTDKELKVYGEAIGKALIRYYDRYK